MMQLLKMFQHYYQRFALDARWDAPFLVSLLVLESLLCAAIILRVPYTEIDWQAYMQQVTTTFRDGERDYLNIKGGTGPLVYPAGFLYLFYLLQWATDEGTNIVRAQCLFGGFYVATVATVGFLYTQAVQQVRLSGATRRSSSSSSSNERQMRTSHLIWSWRLAFVCICLSKRVHSIFVLRLFNDGPTMLLAYGSILLFSKKKWTLGCLVFSLAVSLKMNVLLFAPGLLLLLCQISCRHNFVRGVVLRLLGCCALPQLLLGAPFLRHAPVSYLRKAFELDRAFFYQWTVNFKFLPEAVFTSKPLAIALLLAHIIGLLLFVQAWLRAAQRAGGTFFVTSESMSPVYIVATLLTSNYIGICFARTLHYQFYSWYFHALPYLLWCSSDNNSNANSTSTVWYRSIPVRLVLLVCVESAFLTFPATPASSAVLQLAHLAILAQIRPPEPCLQVVRSDDEPADSAATTGVVANNSTSAIERQSARKQD